MNTMVDRPIFAFESAFLDRLPQHYDSNLDPTVPQPYNEVPIDTRDDAGDENLAVDFHHPNERPMRVADRVSSTGAATDATATNTQATQTSTSSSSSGSLWFLRKRNSKKTTSSSSSNNSNSGSFFGTPSTSSLFSLPAASLNSMNSIGSLASLNSFLRGMNSAESIHKGGGSFSMDFSITAAASSDVFSSSSCHDEMETSTSTLLTRQVTPEEYRGRNRFTPQVPPQRTTSTKTTTTSSSSFPAPPPALPVTPGASAKSAAYLINLYSQARGREPSDKNNNNKKKQPVPTFSETITPFTTDTTTASIDNSPSVPSKTIAASSNTKPKSKRIAAKKATKAKSTSSATATTTTPPAKKRIRRKEPVVRQYVVATAQDVLLGRGGGSNHHPGNIAYRAYILKLQPTYKGLDRDDKTAMSEQVVQWVQQKGRFLKRESKSSPWYIVTDATARQKVSQALREDHTPEGRALKKSRTTYQPKSSSSKKKRTKKE